MTAAWPEIVTQPADEENDEMPTFPPYIERGGQQVFRQPLLLQDVFMRAFVLDADREALQALCDRYLNAVTPPKDVRFIPLVDKAMLVFAEIAQATSLDRRDGHFGWLPEIDVAFWVPVAMLERRDGDYEVADIAWFLPYVFVDNAWAMATGREIYGFQKELARFQIPDGTSPSETFAVKSLVLDPYHPDTQAREETLFEVRREGGSEPGEERIFDDLADAAAEWLGAVFGASDVVSLLWREGVATRTLSVNLLSHLRHGQVPMVFLKQFRDCSDPQRACYRRLIRANADLDEASFAGAGPMWGDYTLSLNDYASHPIARELGLKVGPNHIDTAFWARYGFTMHAGRELGG